MSLQPRPCVFVPRGIINETIAQIPTKGKHLLEPLKTVAAASGLPMNILEDMDVANEAEVHRHEGDLWHCLQGEVTFIYGGRLVNPWAKQLADGGVDDLEIKAKEIASGTEVTLRSGDWLWIPAGQPHLHKKTDGFARLIIIKIPAIQIVPLGIVPGWLAQA